MIMDNYKVERWIFDEGGSNGMSSIWLDKIIDPQNVNDMNYDDLYSLPNLTPIDVTAILKQKDRGYISSDFELKNSPGISYYGYKNVRDFVTYHAADDRVHFRLNSIIRTLPITNNPDDGEYNTIFKDNSLPEKLVKFSVSFNNRLKLGGSFHKYMGQPNNISSKKITISPNSSFLIVNDKIYNLSIPTLFDKDSFWIPLNPFLKIINSTNNTNRSCSLI